MRSDEEGKRGGERGERMEEESEEQNLVIDEKM